MRTFATLLLLVAPILEAAEPAAPTGYVVKVESETVYIDLGAASGAAAGQPFVVYDEAEELKHPVTGASLGRVEATVAEGTIKEVLALYSVGLLKGPNAKVAKGQRAKLGAKPPPPAQPQTAPDKDGHARRSPRWRGPLFDYKAVGMTVAELEPGKKFAVLVDERNVFVYPYPPQDNKPLASFRHPGVAPRFLSIESADLNGNGKEELFASLYNETFTRVETLVFELEGGALKQLAELPWLVRAHQNPEGRKVLAMQQLVEDSTFPFSNIYPVTFADGKFGPGKPAIRHKRVDFLYDFTTAQIDGASAVLYYTSNDRLRVQFPTGQWRTKEGFGQSPVRLRWQTKLLEFHPPLAIFYDEAKKPVFFLVRNLSLLGSLSEPFGLFNNAELHRKTWNGVAMSTEWVAELGGSTTSVQIVGSDVAVAVTGTSGRSSLWIYDL